MNYYDPARDWDLYCDARATDIRIKINKCRERIANSDDHMLVGFEWHFVRMVEYWHGTEYTR